MAQEQNIPVVYRPVLSPQTTVVVVVPSHWTSNPQPNPDPENAVRRCPNPGPLPQSCNGLHRRQQPTTHWHLPRLGRKCCQRNQHWRVFSMVSLLLPQCDLPSLHPQFSVWPHPSLYGNQNWRPIPNSWQQRKRTTEQTPKQRPRQRRFLQPWHAIWS